MPTVQIDRLDPNHPANELVAHVSAVDGFAFAGAKQRNEWLKSPEPAEGEEIASIDLCVDEWAALSACETYLYPARLADGLSTAASTRQACTKSLEARRLAKASTHSFLWGAFVAMGEWR